MKIFVTGGNGFIGSHVVRALCAQGHSVVCLVREGADTSRIGSLPVHQITGNVLEVESVRKGIAGCDAVIHLASISAWAEIDSPAVDTIAVEGTRNILTAAGRFARVVYVSSIAAIGGTRDPLVQDESTAFNLMNESGLRYAKAKHRAELLCQQAVKEGSDVVIVNPAETYGPNDTKLVTSRSLMEVLQPPASLVCAGGTAIVHVEDVVAGILAALGKGRSGERYILAGENVQHRELAELCQEIAEIRQPLISIPRALLPFLAAAADALPMNLPISRAMTPYVCRYWYMDNAKSQRELGVQFRSARETLEPTILWLRQQGHLG